MTNLFKNSFRTLDELAALLQHLRQYNCYSKPCNSLSDASIGQHTRHIIELYQCLLNGYDAGSVNYDERKRNPLYENDAEAAIEAIMAVKDKLQQTDKSLLLVNDATEPDSVIQTNYYREVLYNLEHCIHHQALIKVALINFGGIPVAEGFGVAHSTIQYRKQCAQ